jgi:hypothetical protein
MSNHLHLLLEVKRWPTARIIQSLLTGYAGRFKPNPSPPGAPISGALQRIVCDQDSYLLELVRYIHLNPVRAKLVRRPREWRWSGHGCTRWLCSVSEINVLPFDIFCCSIRYISTAALHNLGQGRLARFQSM